MCALPEATNAVADTVVAQRSLLTFTPAVGDPTHLLVNVVDIDAILEILRNSSPGAGGIIYTSRTWANARTEMLKLETDQIGKVITLLGSLSGYKEGTAVLYLRDPKDADNKVKYKTDAFACSIYRDPATIRASGAAASRTSLVVESTKDGPIAWTKDADQ